MPHDECTICRRKNRRRTSPYLIRDLDLFGFPLQQIAGLVNNRAIAILIVDSLDQLCLDFMWTTVGSANVFVRTGSGRAIWPTIKLTSFPSMPSAGAMCWQ